MFVSEKHGTLALSEQCVLQSLKAGLAAVSKMRKLPAVFRRFGDFFNVMKILIKEGEMPMSRES